MYRPKVKHFNSIQSPGVLLQLPLPEQLRHGRLHLEDGLVGGRAQVHDAVVKPGVLAHGGVLLACTVYQGFGLRVWVRVGTGQPDVRAHRRRTARLQNQASDED